MNFQFKFDWNLLCLTSNHTYVLPFIWLCLSHLKSFSADILNLSTTAYALYGVLSSAQLMSISFKIRKRSLWNTLHKTVPKAELWDSRVWTIPDIRGKAGEFSPLYYIKIWWKSYIFVKIALILFLWCLFLCNCPEV